MGEETNLKYFNELPFQTLTNYDIENDFISGNRKFANLMNNENFQTILTENKYEQLFNPSKNYSCQYYDEGEFSIKNRNGDDFLNVFSLNIRSLLKNGGELMSFLGTLKTEFHVLILTEIGSRNLAVVEKIFPNYTFFFKKFHKGIIGRHGNIYIYIYSTLYQMWDF